MKLVLACAFLVAAAEPPLDAAGAWKGLDHTKNGCSEADLGYDYWPHGGVRNFFCHAESVISWSAFSRAAPMPIWLRGPHKNGHLALHDPHDFGRYNPAFVRWLVDHAVPAEHDAALRAATQRVYDDDVRELARTYFAVYRTLEVRPAWKKAERARYLRAMDDKNPDWGSFYESYSEFLGDADHDWGRYDPNLQSASVAFWLRRDVDGTGPIFFEGLTRLLTTYDAAWLKAQR